VIAVRSGYRTDHLPTDAEQVKRSVEAYTMELQNAANDSDYPNAAQVMRDT